MKQILFSCLVVSWLSGCATSPSTTEVTEATPAKAVECSTTYPCIRQTTGETKECEAGK